MMNFLHSLGWGIGAFTIWVIYCDFNVSNIEEMENTIAGLGILLAISVFLITLKKEQTNL